MFWGGRGGGPWVKITYHCQFPDFVSDMEHEYRRYTNCTDQSNAGCANACMMTGSRDLNSGIEGDTQSTAVSSPFNVRICITHCHRSTHEHQPVRRESLCQWKAWENNSVQRETDPDRESCSSDQTWHTSFFQEWKNLADSKNSMQRASSTRIQLTP
jgi:hypothetical protein